MTRRAAQEIRLFDEGHVPAALEDFEAGVPEESSQSQLFDVARIPERETHNIVTVLHRAMF